jgi:serine phosphatase RsbU (regulator of sigma subunit)
VPLPGGRVAFVLGDVAGHGLSAAAITAQLRHALRAHLLRAAGPAAALDGLNQVIASLLPGEMATAVIAELDPSTGEVVVANAGHLPVLHASGRRAEYLDDVRGPALGLLDEVGYGETRRQLAGDDRLLLFSDGLVERRDVPLPERLSLLQETVATGPVDPAELLDAVLGALNPTGADDVTLVGIART